MLVPEDVQKMKERAEADETYQNRCVNGEKVFYVPTERAYAPGHIYSETGMDEYKISKCCEYHFDKWFSEDEEGLDEGDPF